VIGKHSSIPAERLAAALEGVSPEIAILDAAGVIVYVNSAWMKFAIENGSPNPAAFIGLSYVDVCQKSSSTGDRLAREALEGIRAVSAGILPQFGQKYPCHSREQECWFNMTVTRASGNDDIVIAHSDITQLVQAERGNAEAERRLLLAYERFEARSALAENEERFKNIFDMISDAIVIINDKGEIQSLNRAAERVFGLYPGEAVGSNISLFITETHHMFQEASANALVEGRRKDGSKLSVELCVADWRTAGKRYFAGIMRDIPTFQKINF
jgi:two-component system, NtrC family, sensor kinase